MKVSGSATLHAPVEQVWKALNDPAVLVRTIPGCHQLEAEGADSYRMTMEAGVASIKGIYQGQVALSDQQPPASFRLTASGAGAPGTVSATVQVRLAELGSDETQVHYDADAVVGGMVGGVGQRVLAGVANRTAGQFFDAVDAVLSAPEPISTAERPATTSMPVQSAPTVFTAPDTSAGPGSTALESEFVKGAVFGAVVALLGVLVGRRLGPSR